MAASLGAPSRRYLVLSVYVLASAEIVGLAEVLSLFHEVTRTSFFVGEAILLALAVAMSAAHRPRLIAFGPSTRWPATLALLGLAVAVATVFQAYLVVATPPNNGDSMTYHLSRTAGWYQLHAVERIPGAWEMQNAPPPNGEIELLWTLLFGRGDVVAAVPQFVARVILIFAVFELGRRLRFSREAALFAALVFSCLTVVAAEAVTTQNDLIVAALLASAVVFGLDGIAGVRGAALLAGTAVGLVVGAKLTAVPGLVAATFVWVASARTVKPVRGILGWSIVGFAAFGADVYLRNLVATGSLVGNVSQMGGFASSHSPVAAARTVVKYLADFGDNSAYFKNANEDSSYFGTLGWTLIVPLSAVFGVAWFLRRTSALRGAIALGFPAFLIVLAFTHGYDRFSGRLMIPAVALVAPLIGSTYRFALLRWPIAGLAVVTLGLTLAFNPAKPVGLTSSRPVWDLPRVEAQALRLPEMAGVDAKLNRLVPQQTRLGAVIDAGRWSYPLFGSHLRRRVFYLERATALERAPRLGVRYVVFSVGETPVPRPGWTTVSLGAGWQLAQVR